MATREYRVKSPVKYGEGRKEPREYGRGDVIVLDEEVAAKMPWAVEPIVTATTPSKDGEDK